MASQPGTNKAGRKVGKGTISKERREKRKHLQAGHDGGDGHGGGNSWEREGWWSNSWKEATTPTLGKEAPTTTATLGKETGGMMVGGVVGAQVAAAAMMMTSGQSCHL